MKPGRIRLKLELKRLRRIVETSRDEYEIRIAYAIEQAIRWATEETVGWPTPSQDVSAEAELLKERLVGKRA